MRCFTTIFALVLCSVLYHQADGAGVSKCYTCNDASCDDLKETQCPSADATDYLCYSLSLTLGGETGTTKGCMLKNSTFCPGTQLVGTNVDCATCDKDLCNSARLPSAISLLLLSSLIFLLMKT